MSYEVIAGDCLPEQERIYDFSNFSMSLLLQSALVTFWNTHKSNQFVKMIIFWKINESALLSLLSFLRSQILDIISGFRFHALLNSKQKLLNMLLMEGVKHNSIMHCLLCYEMNLKCFHWPLLAVAYSVTLFQIPLPVCVKSFQRCKCNS